MSDPPPAAASGVRPLWLVIEDGVEYVERFERFLGAAHRFARAGDLGEALRILETGGATRDPAAGLLLDMDFARTPPERLCDEAGVVGLALSAGERKRLCETQGILILRALRARGVDLPAFLFADLDDVEQRMFLERSLPPLDVVPSTESLAAIERRLRAADRSPDARGAGGSIDRTEP